MPRSPLEDGGSALASSTRVSTAKPVCPWVQPWRLLRRALAPRNAALLPSAGPGDSLWDFDACETILLPEGQSRAICSCTGLEFVSVLSHRLRPASALLDALDPEWSEWPRELHGGLQNMTLAGWLWVCIPLAAYVLLMCCAWVLDQRECYSAVVPHWALPGERGFPLWRQCAAAPQLHGTPHV